MSLNDLGICEPNSMRAERRTRSRRLRSATLIAGTFTFIASAFGVQACGREQRTSEPDAAAAQSPCDEDDGQCIFRHDTFGDEQLWTDVLRLPLTPEERADLVQYLLSL